MRDLKRKIYAIDGVDDAKKKRNLEVEYIEEEENHILDLN
jgi:hypothetical protein